MKTLNINKRTFSLIIVVPLGVIILLAMWAINKYQNDRMLDEGYTELFDESMNASYPLIVSYANSLYERAYMFERNAEQASEYSKDIDEFQEILVKLNRGAGGIFRGCPTPNQIS